MEYSIGEFSKVANLSAYTLRYYEKEELIIVKRNSVGRRRYTTQDIQFVAFIMRLKEMGMPIKEIREYARLRYQGDSTIQQRLSLLEKHHDYVKAEKEKWESNLKNLENKMEIYRQSLK